MTEDRRASDPFAAHPAPGSTEPGSNPDGSDDAAEPTHEEIRDYIAGELEKGLAGA